MQLAEKLDWKGLRQLWP